MLGRRFQPAMKLLTSELIPAEGDSHSLMIVLHGLGDSMDGWRWLPGELQLPWLSYLLVNAPDEYYGGFSWFDFAGDSRPGILRSREKLTKLLELTADSGFPSEQTYLLGFSQGSLLTLDVGFRYPNRLAGLIGISGYVFEPENLLRELSPVARSQRALVTHGFEDPLIPFNEVRPQIEMLLAAHLLISWRGFHKEHTIAGPAELSVIRKFVEAGLTNAT